jgi:sulfatase maturation enzyme AslB (radical SAM superfamily)
MPTGLSKTFCIFPFVQTVVRTDGSLGPCCRIQTDQKIQNTSIEDFWHSDDVDSIKKNIITGVGDSRCSVCYNDELQFGKSMRTDALSDYKFYNDKHYLKLLDHHNLGNTVFPKRFELHLGNLCNLKCLTCGPSDSSAFLAENRVLRISDHEQKNYQLSDSTIDKILTETLKHKVDLLDLRGGETMLMPSIKKKLLEWPQDQADNLTIRIQTNCTVMDSDWLEIFKKFKQFEIMMSIDGYKQDNEYIRFPSRWIDIENNVDVITKLTNAKTYVNCTVSNLNLLLLPRLINWCRQRDIFFHWSALHSPAEFAYTNLPNDLFIQAQQNLSGYAEVHALTTQMSDNTHWDNFCQIIDARDNYRKNRIFDILPQLKLYWKK